MVVAGHIFTPETFGIVPCISQDHPDFVEHVDISSPIDKGYEPSIAFLASRMKTEIYSLRSSIQAIDERKLYSGFIFYPLFVVQRRHCDRY
jgi:hypothetical protein